MIVNLDFIRRHITNNQIKTRDVSGKVIEQAVPVRYRWTHGATEYDLGDGILVYALIQFMRAKVCVCLGSGGGYIPRIMTQARYDLHKQKTFTGDSDYNHGDIGATYLVDAANGIGGKIDYENEDSFYRDMFHPRFIKDTTENAYYNFFVKQDIKIDYLHIDADHSYEGVKKDFELYSKLIQPHGIISIHDTDERYDTNLIKTEDEKEYYHTFDGPSKFIKELGDEWQRFDFFNEGIFPSKPSSTGLTLIRHA